MVLTGFAQAQSGSSLQYGINLYGEGRWREAVIELRRVEASDPSAGADALYWISLAELAAGEYEAALKDMDTLTERYPRHGRREELPYHRGRILFYLGRHEEALVLLRSYADGVDEYSPGGPARRAAALYWMGEALFSLGRLDEAGEMFGMVVEQYPQSVKYEASSYRLALINQKKVEGELLSILRWSHEESLKTAEEYQRRERSYDQAIIAYQKKIAELLKDPSAAGPDPRLAELEAANADYQRQLAEAENRSLPAAPVEKREEPPPPLPSIPKAPQERIIRLLQLKAEALELANQLSRYLNEGGAP